MDVTFPGESAEYRAARNELLTEEIELRRQMEAVAAARRKLPAGGEIPEDYVFRGEGPDGSPMDIRLSELFAPGRDSLAIYGPWDTGQGPRHVGTLEPLWNLFDLTPEGRPNWDEQLNYD